MRNALKKPANRAACTLDQLIRSKVKRKGSKTYEDEDSIHLLEPLFLTLTVDDLHSCARSRIRDCTVMWRHTCLHCSIPRQSSSFSVSVLLGNTGI